MAGTNMEIYVLNREFQSIHVFDTFESLIWTERYNEYGDFEIYTPMTNDILTYMKEDYYLYLATSKYLMIIEEIEITSDAENGGHITIKGRSLESVLERRVTWYTFNTQGTLGRTVNLLIDQNFGHLADPERQFSRPSLSVATQMDPDISATKLDRQWTGDVVYDILKEICDEFDYGFRIEFIPVGGGPLSRFSLIIYKGTDRSYDQIENPYVVFSHKFDNLIDSTYYHTKRDLKTVALVEGEEKEVTGSDGVVRKIRKRQIVNYPKGATERLDRREMYVDARDIQSEVNDTVIPEEDYNKLLQSRGKEKLNGYTETTEFEGAAETLRLYKYGVDFELGDIVQIENEYGIKSKSRIVEVIRTQDLTGLTIYPTFKSINE